MKDEDLLSEREEAVALYDVYQGALTEKQSALFSDYYLYDLSFSEIAENRKISRAGVNDALKKSLLKMRGLEKELGFLSKRKSLLEHLEKIQQIPTQSEKDAAFAELLGEVKHGI